jgi:cell wall assembly regulator SMI1
MNITRLVDDLGLRRLSGALETDSEMVADFERSFGKRLPDDYVAFLCKIGASTFHEEVGYVPIEKSPWAQRDDLQVIDGFYGFSQKAGHDLRKQNAHRDEAIPGGWIVIGHDPGANSILLSTDDESFGQVAFFDRDSAKTFLIARSFTDFLNSFRKKA